MTKFNQFLKKELNKSQEKAVTHTKGPIIVVAGAGSGKTRVITARIANLILNEKAKPNSIVALTFTNKAAGEMRERVINFIDAKDEIPFVGTFHSYCLRLLKSNPALLKYPNFSIIDSDDQKSLIKKIIKKYGLEKQLSTAEVVYQISNMKNKLHFDFDNFSMPIIKDIFLEYESEKAAGHNLDFDDLLLEVLKIFKENKKFKKSFQEKIRHVLVDEYQDTNMVQHELLKQMSLHRKKFKLDSLCIVGDEDQSIYSWRGAIATNMLQFQTDFKPVTLIKIEQNYRTVQPILKAANNLIKNNPKRTHKELWSNKKAQNRILLTTCRSGKQEANAIANFINCQPKEKKLNNIAILYRTHYQSRNIEEALITNSIAYKIIGGIRFYERKEIKDLLAYLRLIVNPFDRISLFRIINCPTRGLGSKFEELVYTHWNKNPLLNFKQLLEFIIKQQPQKLTPNKINALKQFLDIYKKIEKLNTPSKQVETILEKTEYLNYLQKSFDQKEAETKIENVKEFIQSIYNFESQNPTENNLEKFLYEVALMQEKMDNKTNIQDQIQCMTLHASKGLEFDTVIITGLEEGLLPSFKSLNTNKELEEERRLFYVGLTRAKERLLLLNANYRNTYGQISDQVTSRFLLEIPTKLFKIIDISEMNIAQMRIQFNDWLGVKNKNVLTFQDFAKKLVTNLEKKNVQSFRPTKQKLPQSSTWKRHQFVNHKTFGVGLIKKIEKKDKENYYLTVVFKSGEKKILSNFVTRI